MAFVNIEEAQPEKDGIYRVMVESIDDPQFETKAKWTNGKGFQPVDGILDTMGNIISWWVEERF